LEFESQVRGLVERLNAGETNALSEIWALFGEHIRRRARTRLREFGVAGKAESMDICNTVLLDMIKQESIKIQNPSDILAYFCRAIDNQVRTVVRSLLSEKRDIRREMGLDVAAPTATNNAGSPSLNLFHAEILEMVAAFLGDRGEEFAKMYLANHSWQEIGNRFNCSPDSARMKWNRAVERVRSQIELTYGDPPHDSLP
jgi:DNA-directed RNA polymerase specialized sigma24 family protein